MEIINQVIKLNETFSNKDLWQFILQADVIAKVKVSTKLRERHLKPKTYLPFNAHVLKVYVGSYIPKEIPIQCYIFPKTHISLTNLIDHEIIIFVVDYRHDPYSKCFYFITTSLEPSFFIYNDQLESKIHAELELQKNLFDDFLKNPRIFPMEKEIKTLIEDMFDSKKAMLVYNQIENLGHEAVPAIIKYMNDRRELVVKHIQLKNKSHDAFEGLRHYGPQQVIDVLAAILNQITGMIFGEIHNGGTDNQRTKVFYCWVVWLQKSQTKE